MKMISEGSPFVFGVPRSSWDLARRVATGSPPDRIDYTESATVTRNGSLGPGLAIVRDVRLLIEDLNGLIDAASAAAHHVTTWDSLPTFENASR